MDVRRALLRARVRIVLPVLAATVGTVAVVSGVEGPSYLGVVGEVIDHALQPSSSIALADSALPSPPVFSLPNLSMPKFLDAAAHSGASATSLDVDGVQHPHVEKWVDRLTTTLKSEYQSSVSRMAQYSDMISSKLAARKMPQELIYLAMIESNFDPNAKSPAHAVGLWQFMGGTARQFGLTVRGRVDERKDPARSTDAALSYLSSLYDRFGSWYLAAAAYNSGEGTVSRALRNVTGKKVGTDADFFRILPKLPRETQEYVPKLIASARVGQSPERYGIMVQQAGEVVTPAAATNPGSVKSHRTASRHRSVASRSKKATHRSTATHRKSSTASHTRSTRTRRSQ
jgi:membrane-bound lytic murein transglycosylase MltF